MIDAGQDGKRRRGDETTGLTFILALNGINLDFAMALLFLMLYDKAPSQGGTKHTPKEKKKEKNSWL